MANENRQKVDEYCWRFLTDLTHWIAESDFKEAVNTLESFKSFLRSQDGK
jgi:hypothetical protein